MVLVLGAALGLGLGRLQAVTGSNNPSAPAVQDIANGSLADGFNAQAGGGFFSNAVAVGISSSAGNNSVAVGQGSLTGADQDTAVGYSSWALGTQSAAFGSNAYAVADGSTAIGAMSFASGLSSTALGNFATASGFNSVAIGAGSQALGTGGIAIGFNSYSQGRNAAALGPNSSADAANSLALGANSKVSASAVNSMALGAGSVATDPDTVSVGNAGTGYQRRITNVAPGTAYSDAATVGQMNDQNTQGQHFATQQAQSAGAVVAASADAAVAASGAHGRNKVALGASAVGGQGGVGLAYQYSRGAWSATLSGGTNFNADYTHVGGGLAFGW
jgi:hypothetical protein